MNPAGILFTDGKKVLLLKRSNNCSEPNTWGLPFGKPKGSETPIRTAIRETKEETGLNRIPGVKIDTIQQNRGSERSTVFVYRVEKPFTVRLSKEHNASKWASLGSLRGMNLHPKFKRSLDQYLRSIKRGIKDFTEWVVFEEMLS